MGQDQGRARRSHERARAAAVAVLSTLIGVAVPATAQTTLTGNWSGNYSYSIQVGACQNKTFTSNGSVTFTLLQVGHAIQGRADFSDFLIFSGNCSPAKGEVTSVIVGTFDGANLALAFPNDSSITQFSGHASGDSISAQISDAIGGTGSLTASRAPANPASVDATGTWSGNYNFTDRCANGHTLSYSGAVTLGLTQSGSQAAGVASLANVPLYDQNCNKIATLNMTMSVAGAVSGGTFSGGVVDPSGSFEFPITATIDSGAMSGMVSGSNQTSTTGSFTLTRATTQRPAADFAGSYEGTYSETDNEAPFCNNIGSLKFSGPASVSIVQAGNSLSGVLILQDELTVTSNGFGGCLVIDAPDAVLPLYGTLSGNTMTATVPLSSGIAASFTVTFDSTTIRGSLTDAFGDLATFTATPGPRHRAVRPSS
ncbi:MAG: hypothetical protein DMF59_19185 [Acidobacteria bacterium]|nr:MAG: hypothetical protein DMF59_19185 [Acidobacteriota bacterium]